MQHRKFEELGFAAHIKHYGTGRNVCYYSDLRDISFFSPEGKNTVAWKYQIISVKR